MKRLPFWAPALIALGLPFGAAHADHTSTEAYEGTSQMTQETDSRSLFARMEGQWAGDYKLWLTPDDPVRESATKAKVEVPKPGQYAVMTYDWAWKGKTQSGVLLVGGKDKMAIISWGDSWHQAPAPLMSEGTFSEDGTSLSVKGTYPAGDGPDWGWRTDLILKDDQHLTMDMYNITPEGEEALAVRATYHRVKD